MISVMILLVFLPFVDSSCQGNGETLRCSHRWNGLGVNIRELTVYKWDGTCLFPAGASVRLFGNPMEDCTSCKYFDNSVTVNGQTCSSDKTTPGQSSATAATWKTSQTVTVRQSTSVTVERTGQDRATSVPMLEACLWTVVILASVYLYNMQHQRSANRRRNRRNNRRQGRQLFLRRGERERRPVRPFQIVW